MTEESKNGQQGEKIILKVTVLEDGSVRWTSPLAPAFLAFLLERIKLELLTKDLKPEEQPGPKVVES